MKKWNRAQIENATKKNWSLYKYFILRFFLWKNLIILRNNTVTTVVSRNNSL